MTTRKFIASSELFCDYSLDISLLNIDTLDDIIEIFKNSLVKIFEENNLTNLKKKSE